MRALGLIPVLLCAVFCGGADLANRDFERVENGQLAGWRVVGDAAAVRPVDPSWVCASLNFNSGPYRKARIYLRLQDAVGTAWFDAVEVRGVSFVNAGFEQVDSKERLVGLY